MTRLAKARSAALVERVERRIFLIRGEKVMLDSDLAEMYGVVTKTLNRAVRRNRERFPSDFMFELRVKEIALLRYQFGTSNGPVGRGGRRYHRSIEMSALHVAGRERRVAPSRNPAS